MSERPVAGSSGPSRAWRVGDRDRDAAAEALGEHYATGRLDQDEYDARTDRAYAARTDVDLRGLFTDLPPPHGPVLDPVVQDAASRPSDRHNTQHGEQPRPRTRGPHFPWLLLVVGFVVLTHAFWLIWLVPVLLWCGAGAARRRGHGPRTWR